MMLGAPDDAPAPTGHRSTRHSARARGLAIALGGAALLLILSGVPSVGETEFTDTYLPVPDGVLADIGALLPEAPNSGAAYLSDDYSPNLLVSQSASVSVTFLWEGSGQRNSLGYFTYSESPLTVLDRQLVFINASFPPDGPLRTGDTVTLRDAHGAVRWFEPGTRIGFFLVADGFDAASAIQTWDAQGTDVPAAMPAGNAAGSRTGGGVFTTLDVLNPELAPVAGDGDSNGSGENGKGDDGKGGGGKGKGGRMTNPIRRRLPPEARSPGT